MMIAGMIWLGCRDDPSTFRSTSPSSEKNILKSYDNKNQGCAKNSWLLYRYCCDILWYQFMATIPICQIPILVIYCDILHVVSQFLESSMILHLTTLSNIKFELNSILVVNLTKILWSQLSDSKNAIFQLIFRISRGIPWYIEGYPNSWDTWDIRYGYYHILSHDNIVCYCVTICLVCGPGDGSRWWAPKCKARRECESLEPVGTQHDLTLLFLGFLQGKARNQERGWTILTLDSGIGIDSEWFASGW